MKRLLYLCSSQVRGQIRTVCWEMEWGKEEVGGVGGGSPDDKTGGRGSS